MTANALVQARVDASVKEKAAQVLDHMGLTVSDAVRILLTRVANEGALPAGLMTDPATHDAWFRARVQEALDDVRPPISHEEVTAQFAQRRAKAMRNTGRGTA